MLRKTILKTIALAGVLAAGLASAASAATYTYNLAGLSASTTSLTVNGLTMTIGAGTFTGGANKVVSSSPSSVITYDASGLGSTAATSYSAGKGTPTLALDAPSGGQTNLREFLTFTFGQTVRLVSVTLSNIMAGSTLIVLENGVVQDEGILTAATSTTAFPTSTYDYNASVFGVGARTGSATASSFYISSVTVEYVAPVPLPAGGLLLGSLVLVPFLRRKRAA